MSKRSNYESWRGMIRRCTNPKYALYKDYGGRGIKVCDRWLNSISAFTEDMGQRPPGGFYLERINNNGNYEPGNCRWATRKEQARNKRNNHLITLDGVTLTLAEWSERSGIHFGTILMRIKLGWPLHRYLETPMPTYERRRRIKQLLAPTLRT